MKILMMSVGSRGNVEPFLAIAEMLKDKGHEVVCAFPGQYRVLADEAGVKFYPLGSEFLDLCCSDLGKLLIGGSLPAFKKAKATVEFYRKSASIQSDTADIQREIIESEKPDKILFNQHLANAKITYPLCWGIKNRAEAILINPIPYVMHYVKERSHAMFNENYGAAINRLTYDIANDGYIRLNLETANKYFRDLRLTRNQIKRALMSLKNIFTVSPSIFPRPDYWPRNAMVLGYHERDNVSGWTPDKELAGFIEQHKKALLITFGSMVCPDPPARTNLFIDICEKNGIPAIFNLAGGGIAEPPEYNKNLIKFTPTVPYGWILPRIYGAIHHGGSGTTQSALKHGCASMIIPHTADQPLWNNLIYELGAGPKGIAADKLTKEKLEPKILDLWNNPSYKKNALKISEKIKLEDYKEELYAAITEPMSDTAQ